MSSLSSALYSNEEAVILQKTDVNIEALSRTLPQDLEKVYEIERCVKYIKEKKCKTVALQFPDSLLIDASDVAWQLENKCDAKIYILADTSYGHCDIDEVNAKHVTSDLLIHYGETSLTPSATIPTLFVFGRHPVEINGDKVCAAFQECFPSSGNTRVVFLHHVTCNHIAEEISDRLLPDYPFMSVAQLNIPKKPGGARGPNEGEEDVDNILKDLCTKSCPGCPCRLENSEKSKTLQNGDATNDKDVKITTKLSKNDSDTMTNSKNDVNSLLPTENGNEHLRKPAKDETRMEIDDSEAEVDSHSPDCKDCVVGCYTIPIEIDKELSDYNIFYLGPKNSESLNNLMLAHPNCDVYVYDLTSGCEKIQSDTNRELVKRFCLIEKAKAAKIVGILAGTMGVAGYLECMNYMKKIGKLAEKKVYTFIMGKLTPEKLANFMEIDIFVVVANPENSILDASNFYRPVITPYEFEVACNPNREWTENYITDFRRILPGGEDFIEFPINPEKDSEPGTGGAVALRNDKTDVAIFGEHSSAQRLSQRSWKGLEQKIGETGVAKATTGRSGIAASYGEIMDF